MQIEKNRVVTLHYTVHDGEGKLIESSADGAPLSYLHGKGGIIPGLERALAGRSAGDRFDVTVPPEQGYGRRDERLIQIVPRSRFAGDGEITPGAQLRASGQGGNRIVTVVKVERDFVTVDANHPLAGRTLVFSVEIAEVRKATHEEVAHGHVHGSGGHHH